MEAARILWIEYTYIKKKKHHVITSSLETIMYCNHMHCSGFHLKELRNINFVSTCTFLVALVQLCTIKFRIRLW